MFGANGAGLARDTRQVHKVHVVDCMQCGTEGICQHEARAIGSDTSAGLARGITSRSEESRWPLRISPRAARPTAHEGAVGCFAEKLGV